MMIIICLSAILLVTLVNNCFISANSNSRIQSNALFTSNTKDKEQLPSVLILDLDGTLYDNDCLIESEIRNNYRIFAKDIYDVSIDQCTAMRIKYGSTVRGLSVLLNSKDVFVDYYNHVYPRLDMSRLQKYSRHSKNPTGYSYHRSMQKAHQALHKITNTPIVIASNSPVFHVKRVLTRIGLANLNISAYFTPERFNGVMKTEKEFWDQIFKMFPKDKYSCTLIDDNYENIELVRKLGMRGLHIREDEGVTFSDCLIEHIVKISQYEKSAYQFDANKYLVAKNEIDSLSFNADVWKALKTQLSYHLHHRLHYIKDIHGVLASAGADNFSSTSAYNPLKNDKLNVLDLGSGHLNMFLKVTELIKEINQEKLSPSSIKKLHYIAVESNIQLYPHVINTLFRLGLKEQSQFDQENIRLFSGTISGIDIALKLCSLDFMTQDGIKLIHAALLSSKQAETNYYDDGFDLIIGACIADLYEPNEFSNAIIELSRDQGGILYLPITFNGNTQLCIGKEYTKSKSWFTKIDNEEKLSSSAYYDKSKLPKLQRIKDSINTQAAAGTADINTNIYTVFDTYHAHLRSLGHHLSASNLSLALIKHGCHNIASACGVRDVCDSSSTSSDWHISKHKHPYMWRTMLHFILHGVCFELFDKFDLQQWVKDLLSYNNEDLCFVVKNQDLLFELPKIERYIHHQHNVNTTIVSSLGYRFSNSSASQLISSPSYHYTKNSTPNSMNIEASKKLLLSRRKSVEFIAPELLKVVDEEVPEELPDTYLRIKTDCTLISTGTELKVFKGELQGEDDEPMDLTIKGMSSNMKYPLRYGYSLVGTVEAVGSSLNDTEWLGQRVFAFCPHTTCALVDVSAVQRIPLGIDFEDAVFLPSVETAVSLVMDAQPMIGERVAIVGQGLIGQLTAAILKSSMPDVDLTVLDISDTKLMISKDFIGGQLETLNPLKLKTSNQHSKLFDLCIEVSGSMNGLQTAVDNTLAGGRIVIGSWYNTVSVQSPPSNAVLSGGLKLGTRFHRSGIQLIASQVSMIPARLTNRWDKVRRFHLAWKYLSKIRPSKLLSLSYTNNFNPSIVNISDTSSVQATYQSLSKGILMTAILKSYE